MYQGHRVRCSRSVLELSAAVSARMSSTISWRQGAGDNIAENERHRCQSHRFWIVGVPLTRKNHGFLTSKFQKGFFRCKRMTLESNSEAQKRSMIKSPASWRNPRKTKPCMESWQLSKFLDILNTVCKNRDGPPKMHGENNGNPY